MELNKRKASLISGVLFSLFVLFNIWDRIQLKYSYGYAPSLGIGEISFYFVWISFAVLCFLQKNNQLCIVVAAVNALRNIIYCVLYFSAWNLVYAILGITLLGFVLLVSVESLKKYSSILPKIWYVPALLGAANFVFISQNWKTNRAYLPGKYCLIIAIDVSFIAATAFFGYWLKECADNNEPEQANVSVESADVNVGNPGESGADKIKTYKELLDCGIITQEEFELKKRQILDQF